MAFSEKAPCLRSSMSKSIDQADLSMQSDFDRNSRENKNSSLRFWGQLSFILLILFFYKLLALVFYTPTGNVVNVCPIYIVSLLLSPAREPFDLLSDS